MASLFSNRAIEKKFRRSVERKRKRSEKDDKAGGKGRSVTKGKAEGRSAWTTRLWGNLSVVCAYISP